MLWICFALIHADFPQWNDFDDMLGVQHDSPRGDTVRRLCAVNVTTHTASRNGLACQEMVVSAMLSSSNVHSYAASTSMCYDHTEPSTDLESW